MASTWYRLIACTFRTLYYHRITLSSTQQTASVSPTLYVALHRNGAIDGYVYMRHAPRAQFMLASQLKRNAFIRAFFDGIEVVRDKDGDDQSGNTQSLAACTLALERDQPLLVFPEGTSDLGFRHLPFKKGAARIAEAFVETGRSLRIVPLALHYEAGWAWQSNVDLVVGSSFEIQGKSLGTDPARARRRLDIHRRVVSALETIGVSAPDAASFANWERLAYAVTLGTRFTYAAALKVMEARPEEARRLGTQLDALIEHHHPWLHQGIPITAQNPWRQLLELFLNIPFACLLIAFNAPVLALSFWAGRRFADDRNVIAFWRFVIGSPLLAIWAIGIAITSLTVGKPVLFAAWAFASIAGLSSFHRVRTLAVQLANTFLRPQMSAAFEVFQQKLSRLVNDPVRR